MKFTFQHLKVAQKESLPHAEKLKHLNLNLIKTYIQTFQPCGYIWKGQSESMPLKVGLPESVARLHLADLFQSFGILLRTFNAQLFFDVFEEKVFAKKRREPLPLNWNHWIWLSSNFFCNVFTAVFLEWVSVNNHLRPALSDNCKKKKENRTLPKTNVSFENFCEF